MKFSACPLDCYDACGITYENGKIKPSRDLITNGKLCLAFGYMQNEKTLQDKDLQNTLQKVVDKLKEPNKKILYYKGYGNMGVLQNTPKLFFEKIKATVAVGSICDEAGEAGLKLGRGNSVNPDIADLLKSEVIIVWGRSFTTSSSHIYNLVKDKTFITIDPVKNKIANLSKLHLQITPKGDYILAQELMNKLDNKDINYEKLSTRT
jgi:anaerobic selenocysteine-containing dehydrogenase